MTSVNNLMNLNGQRALVTGASGNIGRGIAIRLAEAGADVIVHFAGNSAGANETAEAICATGSNATILQADLTRPECVAKMFEEIGASGTTPTCIVNNAGSYPTAKFVDMSANDWQQVITENLSSAAFVCQEAIRRLHEEVRPGAIVNIASIEGLDPAMDHSHYSASKAALIMLAKSLTTEYAHWNIRINTVSPGLIWRDNIENVWPDGVRRWLQQAPLKKMGSADDIANAVLFLLSAASKWISGVNIVVDGGMSSKPRW